MTKPRLSLIHSRVHPSSHHMVDVFADLHVHVHWNDKAPPQAPPLQGLHMVLATHIGTICSGKSSIVSFWSGKPNLMVRPLYRRHPLAVPMLPLLLTPLHLSRFEVDEESIQRVLCEKHVMEALEEVTTPERFISEVELDDLLAKHKPEFVPVAGREAEGPLPPQEAVSGVVQRRLSNGVTLSYKVTTNEPGVATARMCGSGGRAAEPRSGKGVGAMQVGMRTSTLCCSRLCQSTLCP
jgi:hypothetical protein